MSDLISRQAAIRWVKTECNPYGKPTLEFESGKRVIEHLKQMPSEQPEIIRCKDCEYGEQDEVGRWFCRSLGCQIGNEDGSGYCADAERRADE